MFLNFEKKKSSKVTRILGFILILLPYVVILCMGLYEIFTDSSEPFLIKAAIGTIVAGFILLLGYTIKGRVIESKTDKYKEIIR